MGEGQLSRLVILKVPKVGEPQPHVKANRPIIIFSVDRIRLWPTLRVAANAGVVRRDIIEPRRIDDRGAHGISDMGAAWAMAGLAADVPLGDAFCLDVVVDRMATVAQRSGRPLHI